jgi:hypothetical protein
MTNLEASLLGFFLPMYLMGMPFVVVGFIELVKVMQEM